MVGLRPTPGRVPHRGATSNEKPALHAVVGPMARNTPDLALFMDTIFENHPDDRYSLPAPSTSFSKTLQEYEEHLPKKIAWSPTLGVSPIQPEIIEICGSAVKWFENINVKVSEACMDLSKSAETFQILRAAMFQDSGWVLEHSDIVKPELVWQVKEGLNLKAEDLARAQENQRIIVEQSLDFFKEYDILCSPCVMVPPFDVKVRWLTGCEGVHFSNYVDWLIATSALSLLNCPSISIPCGFTKDGLPVGLQMTSKPFSESELLCAAYAFEKAHPFAQAVPIDPKTL